MWGKNTFLDSLPQVPQGRRPWMLVMLRMNRGFMDYMRKTYPNTPLSEFRTVDAYVRTHGLDALVDDEEEEKDEEV